MNDGVNDLLNEARAHALFNKKKKILDEKQNYFYNASL